MDREYLENILGSPHVDEGLGNRIAARGKAGMQRLSGMTGGAFSDLNYTKIDSSFKNFLSRITPALKDFADPQNTSNVSNRLEQMRPPISSEQREIIKSLRDLYNFIVPTNLKKTQVGGSILKPRRYDATNIAELVREGIMSREMDLNSALQSNDPSKILNAYVNTVKNEYNSFIADAKRLTNSPITYIRQVVSTLNPSKWKPILDKVENIVNTYSTEEPSNVSPEQDPVEQPAQSSTAQATTQPTQASAKASTPPPVPTNGKTQGTMPAAGGAQPPTSQSGDTQEEKDDFAHIVSRVMDILISAVKSDSSKAGPFLGPKQEKLPTTWDEPSLTKEAAASGSKEKEDFEDIEGEFLYNFAGRYDKARNFAIDVPVINKKQKYIKTKSSGKLKRLDVIWANKSHENDIYVRHRDVDLETNPENGKTTEVVKSKPEEVLLFRFYDQDVDPRSPVAKRFSVPFILKQANPLGADMLAGADPNLTKEINDKQDSLFRALYATTHRKAMEFKSKKRGIFNLTSDVHGNVILHNRQGGQQIFYKDKEPSIGSKINSSDPKEAQQWIASLENIKYFDDHPEMFPKISQDMDDAIKTLVAMGSLNQKGAAEKVKSASQKLGPDASAEQLVKAVLAEPKPEEPKPVSAPVTMPVSKSGGEPPATATVSTPVSKPAGNEPPSSPVSAPATATHPKPEQAQQKQELPKIDPSSGSISFGGRTWTAQQAKPNTLRKILKAMGYDEKKYFKKNAAPTSEGFINPFQRDNFFLN
jgi:hypothetical protein